MEHGVGLIHIDLFTTLDGVAQAPGGPDEDTENGFIFGGYTALALIAGAVLLHRRDIN